MRYFIYQITNVVTGQIYIGAHATKNPEDEYMGSGTRLRRSQKKYGLSAFKKEILEECSSIESMYTREQELVNESFVSRPDTFNIRIGGLGGWSHINFKERSKNPVYLNKLRNSTIGKTIQQLWQDPVYRQTMIQKQNTGKATSLKFKEARKRVGMQLRGRKRDPDVIRRGAIARTGQKRSPEQCARISEGRRLAKQRRAALSL